MRRLQKHFLLFGLIATASLAAAQPAPGLNNMTTAVTLASPAIMPTFIQPVVVPCARPTEPFDVDDYSGPLNQVVARFSQSIEKTTVHIPRHHGIKPCSLSAADKFHMFVESTADPINYVGAGWDAAIAQLDRDDPSYQQGAAGYGKRYGAAVTDNVTSDFFGIFLYPSLFHQDPRYYRMGQGPAQQRLGHALVHRFVTQSDSGTSMPNYSEWFGTVSSKALTNLYHPGNQRGFTSTASRVGFSVANDMAWDVLREFWPEIAHKFKLPFRTHNEPYSVIVPARPVAIRPSIASTSENVPTESEAVHWLLLTTD